MKKTNILIICLISLFFTTQSAYALTASSENYSVSMFGTGVQASNLDSADLTGHSILLANAGTSNAENAERTANIGFWSNTSFHVTVSITSFSINPKIAPVGSSISLFISAKNSQNVWAKITSPNNQEQILTLVNNQEVIYLPNPSVVGRYNVTFFANSSSGAIASVVDFFELEEQSTPPQPPSSGGGGTTTIIETSCNYNWDCTPWSLCSDGINKRECKNTGTCNGTESKPIEEMQCSEALFDISLKFGILKLERNNTLKFNIYLIENIGKEKIDVHIKYSIIDSENNEIFSQIETRAILGNLTFEKEFNETKLEDGDYILRVDVLYGNLQRAFAELNFKVIDNIIYPSEGSENIIITTPTGSIIGELSNPYKGTVPVFLIIISVLALIFALRKNITVIYRKFIDILSEMSSFVKVYPQNSIFGLINKRVYSDNGQYIGKVNNVILKEGRIKGLKIKLDKKYKFKADGIIVYYRFIKSIREIIIVDRKIYELLEINKDSEEN